MSTPPQDVYARLLSSPRGYPLWTPEPSNELLVERQDGLRIGDVGVVIPDDGGFDVFFNICLPWDHPFHRRHGVPDGFTSINPGELDIRTLPNAENPGRVIPSASVTRVEVAEPSSDVLRRDQSDAQSYRFSLSCEEGAILILPKGAERYELLNDDLFLEQAKQHGLEWYDYAVNRRRRIIGCDSLYMISGLHKTRSWSVSAFGNAKGNDNHSAHFKYMERGGPSPVYSWEATRTLDWRVGPYTDVGIPNQAVFIRGFKITLRGGLLGMRKITVEADTPSTRISSAKLAKVILGSPRLLSCSTGWSKNRENTVPQATTHSQGSAGLPTKERSKSDAPQHSSGDTYVEIKRIPAIRPLFHPTDAINQYLLRKEPSAKLAVTNDKLWIAILEEGLLTLEQLADESLLEKVLSHNYTIVSSNGTVHLERL